jgi:electron transport complex protein RnfB
VGQPCRQTEVRRTCLVLRGIARHALESGTALPVAREEALSLLDRAEKEGLVLQPENAQDPLFICFCCGCCCGVLAMAKHFPRPADYVHSNHRAAVDPELCTDCEACRERCPMEALRTESGRTAVDAGRCIGCGACVTTCPSGALRLVEKGPTSVPPKSHEALYRKILVERFGLLGTARMMGKAALGRRV